MSARTDDRMTDYSTGNTKKLATGTQAVANEKAAVAKATADNAAKQTASKTTATTSASSGKNKKKNTTATTTATTTNNKTVADIAAANASASTASTAATKGNESVGNAVSIIKDTPQYKAAKEWYDNSKNVGEVLFGQEAGTMPTLYPFLERMLVGAADNASNKNVANNTNAVFGGTDTKTSSTAQAEENNRGGGWGNATGFGSSTQAKTASPAQANTTPIANNTDAVFGNTDTKASAVTSATNNAESGAKGFGGNASVKQQTGGGSAAEPLAPVEPEPLPGNTAAGTGTQNGQNQYQTQGTQYGLPASTEYASGSMEALLQQWLNAAIAQQENATDYATEQGIYDLQQQQAEADAQYQQQLEGVDIDEARAKDNQVLYSEARGDRGGVGAAQYASIMNTAALNRVAINNARTKLANNTANQIAQLRAQGEYEKANATLELTQKYLSELMDLEKWNAEFALDKQKFNLTLSKWQYQVDNDIYGVEDEEEYGDYFSGSGGELYDSSNYEYYYNTLKGLSRREAEAVIDTLNGNGMITGAEATKLRSAYVH